MTFSKQVTEYTRIFGLTPEEVFYCMLLTEGAEKIEAYNIIFRPIQVLKQSRADILTKLHKKDGINKLCEFLRNKHFITSSAPNPANGKIKKKEIEELKEKAEICGNLRTKEAILTQLEETAKYLNGKERADVLIKIADLQQMKKEEKKEEEEKIIYYLPLRCNKCELFLNNKKS